MHWVRGEESQDGFHPHGTARMGLESARRGRCSRSTSVHNFFLSGLACFA